MKATDNTSTELFPIFKPLLKGITGLMKEQLRLANEAGLQVQVQDSRLHLTGDIANTTMNVRK
jgi:hypothetical protein